MDLNGWPKMSTIESPFVLGTAQLGLQYGIKSEGKPDQVMATKIIDTAWQCGIREFDTAQGYGNSEEVLGEAFYNLGISNNVAVTSKLSPETDFLNPNGVIESVNQSLEKLKSEQLHCLMLHREEMLDQWNEGIDELFFKLKQLKKISFAGVSVYSPAKAAMALKLKGIDAVQLPSNLLDHRFEKKGIFALARSLNKKIYIRSIFLQGLILMAEQDINDNMSFTIPVIRKIEQICKVFSLSRMELSLSYLKSAYPDQKIIFGADTADQVKTNVRLWNSLKTNSDLVKTVGSQFDEIEATILDPSLWPR